MNLTRKANGKNIRKTLHAAHAMWSSSRVTMQNNGGHAGVSRSLRFMANYFSRPIQLGDMVKTSGMSRRGFIKAFNRHVGRTPGTVLRQLRIEFAKQLLVEDDLPLKIIASRTGFRSENTFCVAFSRAMGIAPKKYQRQVWLAERRNLPKLSNPFLQPCLKS